MTTPNEPGTGQVIAGTMLLVAAAGGAEWLMWHLGGLIAVGALPAVAFLAWLGYRLITVPVPAGTTGNAPGPELVQRERPRPDQPHTW